MASRAPITGVPTRAPHSRGNVQAIRPGIKIPDQRPEDDKCIMVASIAARFADRAYEHAQTDPNSEAHRVALHMAGMADELPRNNLRLLIRPLTPHKVWFYEASARVRVARSAYELVEARRLLACHLDLYDRGGRAAEFEADWREKKQALNEAIVDALRTPTTRKSEVRTKQEMVGKREWAEKYRPEWQAMIDEDLARYPFKPRKGGC